MPNKVEIEVTSTDRTRAGFASARANATRAGTESGEAYDRSFERATRNTGTSTGRAISDNVAKNIKFNSSAAQGLEKSVKGALTGVAGAVGGQAGAIGVAIGAGIVGGLSVGLTAGGAVGLAGYLLKDNEKVAKAWGTTWENITNDAKRRAGFLEDEFVAGAERTAQRWENSLGPALERVFKAAEPLVDDFIDMPVDWLEALAPGVEKAVRNAEPVVQGLGDMGSKIFGAIGDGIGDLSEKSGDMKVAFELAGDGAAAAFRGFFGVLGDISTWTAENEGAIREWGANVAKVAGNAVDEIGRIGAALISPTGHDPENKAKFEAGQPSVNNLEKALGGADVKPADGKSWSDIRNIPGLIDKKGREVIEFLDLNSDMYKGQVDTHVSTGTDRGRADTSSPSGYPSASSTAPSETFRGVDVVMPVALAAWVSASQQAVASMASFKTEVGLTNSMIASGQTTYEQAASATSNWTLAQDQLVASGTALTAANGNNAASMQTYVSAINSATAAGLPLSASLLGTVGSMNSAELAAIGATVRMDGLGNAIVSIPGQKDIQIDAETLAAQNNLDGVQTKTDSLTGKTVVIDVITNYVTNHFDNYQTNGVPLAPRGAAQAALNDGGWVPGGGPNRDTVATALTPGEFVVNRDDAKRNASMLEAINGGGSDLRVAGLGGSGSSQGSGGYGSGNSGGGDFTLSWAPGSSGDALLTALQNMIRISGGNSKTFGL